MNFEDFSFDILPEIKAPINFSEAFQRKNTLELEGTKIHFMNHLDLIEDKKATARLKDLKDIKELKKIKGKE